MPRWVSAAATPSRSAASARVPSAMAAVRHCSSQQLSGVSGGGRRLVVVGRRCHGDGDGCQAAGVDGEQEQPEVGVALVVEDVVEVELDVGLFGQAGGVPEQPQGVAVGDDSPEVAAAAVEVALQHGLGCAGRHAKSAAIEADTAADEVQRHDHRGFGGSGWPREAVGDREVHRLGLAEARRQVDPAGQGLRAAEAQFVEQGQQPLVAGQRRGRVAGGQAREGHLPGAVGAERGVPGAGDGGADRHAGGELVVRCALAGHPQVDGAGQGLARQDGADGGDGAERGEGGLPGPIRKVDVDAEDVGWRQQPRLQAPQRDVAAAAHGAVCLDRLGGDGLAAGDEVRLERW